MLPKLRTIGITLFILAMLGYVTHVLGSGLFLIALLVATGFNIAYLKGAKKFPFNKAERVQATADRASSFAEPIPAGYGVIYAFREGKLPGAVIEVTLDDNAAADIAQATFAKWTVPAGRHTLRANGKGPNAVPLEQASAITVDLAAGQSAYLSVKVGATLSRFTAQLVQEPDGPASQTRLQNLSLARPGAPSTPLAT